MRFGRGTDRVLRDSREMLVTAAFFLRHADLGEGGEWGAVPDRDRTRSYAATATRLRRLCRRSASISSARWGSPPSGRPEPPDFATALALGLAPFGGPGRSPEPLALLQFHMVRRIVAGLIFGRPRPRAFALVGGQRSRPRCF